jgi:hypothetical protein
LYRYLFFFFAVLVLVITKGEMNMSVHAGEILQTDEKQSSHFEKVHKKINFLPNVKRRRTPNPAGWEGYDGTVYDPERGYGWLIDRSRSGRDRGLGSKVVLADGSKASIRDLKRNELTTWQGFEDSDINVFKVDLPNGWYKVTCSSVDPGSSPLPLKDLRCFKCRGNDVVFAGANYGRPVVVGGDDLVEGEGIVEVTDGHLRIVVGDPAYGGWTWAHTGPWYSGWAGWIANDYGYAKNWYQRFIRKVDPGYHSIRMNAMEIESVEAPEKESDIIFRDFFNRDNSQELNEGVSEERKWSRVQNKKSEHLSLNTELYHTSIKVEAQDEEQGELVLIQKQKSPESGIIRYSTRVSLFNGAGSNIHSGIQEAGITILVIPNGQSVDSTFVGVGLDSTSTETMGWVKYRVADGTGGYRTDIEIPDTVLPFKITEGEYEIVVDHDVEQDMITALKINNYDVTKQLSYAERSQRLRSGYYGIGSMINNMRTGIHLAQFYWYYRVEQLNN